MSPQASYDQAWLTSPTTHSAQLPASRGVFCRDCPASPLHSWILLGSFHLILCNIIYFRESSHRLFLLSTLQSRQGCETLFWIPQHPTNSHYIIYHNGWLISVLMLPFFSQHTVDFLGPGIRLDSSPAITAGWKIYCYTQCMTDEWMKGQTTPPLRSDKLCRQPLGGALG